jgi:Mn-dependent DtxR family transcriptional regulator
MGIHESAENYLETILILSNKLPFVRSIDISNELGYKKSSVSVAMKNLRENALISVDNLGYISLTDEGKKIAEHIYERHNFLCDWLVNLGVSKDIAEDDACKLEHILSPESYAAIKNNYTISKQ